MAATQMALPVDRRNGASAPRPSPTPTLVAPVPASVADAAVETVAGVPPWVRVVTTASVLAVALVAAVASYEHMRALAELAGGGGRSCLLPISVDGLAVAASMTMLVRRRCGQPAGALPWVALLLGLGASLAANVAAPGAPGGFCCPTSSCFSRPTAAPRGGLASEPSAPVLSNPSMEAHHEHDHDDRPRSAPLRLGHGRR